MIKGFIPILPYILSGQRRRNGTSALMLFPDFY